MGTHQLIEISNVEPTASLIVHGIITQTVTMKTGGGAHEI